MAKRKAGSQLAIWLPTIKSQESVQFPCVQAKCDIPLKDLDEGYNFASDRIVIGGLHRKLCALKVTRVPTVGISGLPGTKNHLDVAPMERHKVYYKGESGGFPQIRAVVSLVCPNCPWLVLAPKVLQYALTTLCWFCAGPCEWVNLSLLPSPIPELQHAHLPFYNAASQGACPSSFAFRCF
jgi:hypothetical protein